MVASLRMKNENYTSIEQSRIHSSFFIFNSSFNLDRCLRSCVASTCKQTNEENGVGTCMKRFLHACIHLLHSFLSLNFHVFFGSRICHRQCMGIRVKFLTDNLITQNCFTYYVKLKKNFHLRFFSISSRFFIRKSEKKNERNHFFLFLPNESNFFDYLRVINLKVLLHHETK